MKVTEIIRKETEKKVIRESWEIKYDVGWDFGSWETVADCATLEKAITTAIKHGVNPEEIIETLQPNHKTEYRALEEGENFVFDYYHAGYGIARIALTHYYFFD